MNDKHKRQHPDNRDDDASFSHGLDEDNSMTADQDLPDSDAERDNDSSDEVAEEDKQVNDPDVDTRPAQPVEHTSNVVGRRNPDLPTSNLSTPSTSSTDTASAGGTSASS